MRKPLFPAALAASLLLTVPAFADTDGDGIEPPTDCDDNNSMVYPGAAEIVGNSVDENCDGGDLCYEDGDNDGAANHGGTFDSSDLDCVDNFEGSTSDPIDCNDTDPDIHPGGTETCIGDDPNDYNCDGMVACDDPTCTAAPDCIVEVFDHIECFKVKTTEILKATLDLDPGSSSPFQPGEGCSIGKAAKVCVPIMKTVAVIHPKTTLTEDALFEGEQQVDPRICYKVKCPADSLPVPSGMTIQLRDRFGNREFTKVKVSEICTPAEIVP